MHDLLEVTSSLIYAEIGFKLNNCYDYKLLDVSRVDPLGGGSTIVFDNRATCIPKSHMKRKFKTRCVH